MSGVGAGRLKYRVITEIDAVIGRVNFEYCMFDNMIELCAIEQVLAI